MAFLMNSQRRDLAQVLKEQEFNLDDFEITHTKISDVSSELGDSLHLKGTNYFFAIFPNESEYQHEKFVVAYSPGDQKIREVDLCGDWILVVYKFAHYLSGLRRELEATDPWGEADRFKNAVKSLPHTADPNTPISESERIAVWKALSTIQATLLQHVQDSEEKTEFIEQHFRTLHDAATKFGRKDYLMLLYTTIIGVATTMGLPSYVWPGLLQPLTNAVGHLLKLLH
jgi:hypothetical protein